MHSQKKQNNTIYAQFNISAQRMINLIKLIRLPQPIGILLLLWPTLWSLWLAAKGLPELKILTIFVAGVILTRSAGCAINDYADRHIDTKVQRTRHRPLAQGHLPPSAALWTTAILSGSALLLVSFTNLLTIQLAFVAALLSACYPFCKRFLAFPQLILGCAFSCAIPMAYSAQTQALDYSVGFLMLATITWTMSYDTFYACADRPDDLKAGVKSTAVLFGRHVTFAIASLQISTLLALSVVGHLNHLGPIFYCSLLFATALFVYQHRLAKKNHSAAYLAAFKNNHWVGMIIFLGIYHDLLWQH